LVGLGSFVTGSSVPESVEAQSKSSAEMVGAQSISQAELGRQLFLAKGCITCHYNSKAASESEYWTIDNGAPNLSKFSASPEVLRLRLKNPTSVKSDTQMPNLNLAEGEIEALIAFINSK
jgi:mono/diheme cytochrome c family protein